MTHVERSAWLSRLADFEQAEVSPLLLVEEIMASIEVAGRDRITQLEAETDYLRQEAAAEAALFPAPNVVEPVLDEEKVTERHMLDLLQQRYTRISMGAHRYAVAEHVGINPGFPGRIADFIAADCYGSTRGFALHGHEVKCSRADWLTELRDPDKAEAFRRYMDYWWLVAANTRVCRLEELPVGWGLMVKSGDKLRAVVQASRFARPEPMPRALLVSLLRATAKTSRNYRALSREPAPAVDSHESFGVVL